MTEYIYGLYCPTTGALRYVGKAINLKRRLTRHLKDAGDASYKGRWIAKLIAKGQKPELRIIRTLAQGHDWQEAEREEIAKALAAGCRLTNLTKGGDGIVWATPELEQKWLERRAQQSRNLWSERRAEMSAKIGAARRSDGSRQKTSEQALRLYADPEYRKRHNAAMREAFQRPEVKERLKASQLESWAKNKVKRCEAVFTPQTRRKMSEAAKARWSDPVKSASEREFAASPDRRRQLSELAKKRATPEYRAMMAEKTRLSWEKRRQAKG